MDFTTPGDIQSSEESSILDNVNLDQHPGIRVKWIVDEFHKGVYSHLAERIDVQPATVKQILDQKVYPSWKVIIGILDAHPEVNSDWFLFNRGPKQRILSDSELNALEENHRLRSAIQDLYRLYVDGR